MRLRTYTFLLSSIGVLCAFVFSCYKYQIPYRRAKNNLIKSLMETQTVALEAITNLKEKPQDQRELSNVTYKQQIQQYHQGHQNNQQKFLKNTKQQQNHRRHFQNQRH